MISIIIYFAAPQPETVTDPWSDFDAAICEPDLAAADDTSTVGETCSCLSVPIQQYSVANSYITKLLVCRSNCIWPFIFVEGRGARLLFGSGD